jgi:hypothetical protein
MQCQVDQVDIALVIKLALIIYQSLGTAPGKCTTVPPEIIPPRVVIVVDCLLDDKVLREHLWVGAGTGERLVGVEVFPLGDELAAELDHLRGVESSRLLNCFARTFGRKYISGKYLA